MIAELRQTCREIGCIKDQRRLRCRFAAREASSKQAWMASRRYRCGQETRKEGMVRRIGKAAWRVALLPPGRRQVARKCGQVPQPKLLLSHVVAQRIERDEQQIVRAYQGVEHC